MARQIKLKQAKPSSDAKMTCRSQSFWGWCAVCLSTKLSVFLSVCLCESAGPELAPVRSVGRMLQVLCIAASSGLLSPSLRVTGQGSAQRAVDARANTRCAWPAWLNSDLDERARAVVKPVGVQPRRGLRPLGEKGFKTLSTSIDDACARLSVSILLGPWVVAAGPSVRVRLVSALLLVGATPFLLHLIERISLYPRSWIRDMLRGNWP